MPFSPAKTPSAQRVWCKNAAALAVGLIVFELGFLAARVAPDDASFHAAKKILFSWNVTSSLSGNVDGLPSPLTRVCPLVRGAPYADFHTAHRFSQPLVMHVYQRFKEDGDAELVIITTGVSMGTFKRNFSAAGCMIGEEVFPVVEFASDRTICTVPRKIKIGTPITLVVHKDDVVEEALKGPVKIAKELVAELEEGDLTPLEEDVVLHGQLDDYGVDGFMKVRSKLVWQGQGDPFDTTQYRVLPRYEICVATQIKPSIHLLSDWIDYHRKIGVDHVYVYDNNAEEDLAKMFADRHDVDVVYWPWEKSQIQSFTYSLFPLRARCEWLLLMDTDEYIMVGLGGNDDLSERELAPFKDYVKRKEAEGYAQLWFHWVIMKNSGYVTPPPKPVPEAYIHREDPQLNEGQIVTLGKTMVRMDKEWVNSNAHGRRAIGRAPVFDDQEAGMFPSKLGDTARIVHYRRRSWEEYSDKLRFGRANINNPMTVSKLKRYNRRSSDEFRERYMRESKNKAKVYTHFRTIWRRVHKELRVGTSVTVRYKGKRRCRTFYDFSREDYAKPLREKCVMADDDS